MTAREKRLGVIVLAMLGVGLLFGLVNALALAPARKANEDMRNLRKRAEQLKADNTREGYYKWRYSNLKPRTFGDDELSARDALESWIMDIARQSGLSTAGGWTLKPAGRGMTKRGAYRELAWNVTADGKLDHVVNFLYLLEADPHLHRISSLSLTPQKGRGVKVRLKYSTIVLEIKKAPKIAASGATTLPASPGLDSPDRARLAAIAHRDLLRPYVKRPVRVVARPSQDRRPPEVSGKQPPKPAVPVETFQRVVSLSKLGEKAHICIADTRSGDVQLYSVGDKLAGGEIVLVDYRQMPRVDNPEILSGSRVIVRVGPGYWAVELGRTLVQKHRLRQEQLPPELKVSSAADSPAKTVSSERTTS